MAISQKRRRELKTNLGTMIDLAWRSNELVGEEEMTPEEDAYLEKVVLKLLEGLFGHKVQRATAIWEGGVCGSKTSAES